MKRLALVFGCLFLAFCGCWQQTEKNVILQRSFYNNNWERFDFVKNTIDVKEKTSYDLNLRISFTEDYPYNDFSMIFTVFDAYGDPYRAKAYKFNLKDSEGQWNGESRDGCHTFELPINKSFLIADPGKYTFQIENYMPITPLVGVKELTLYKK